MSTRFLSAYVLLLFAAAICRAEPDNILSKKILGSWAWKKVETFYANGKWELRKYEGASPEPGKFSWQIKSGKLIRRVFCFGASGRRNHGDERIRSVEKVLGGRRVFG
jgi:hypothetical protein